MTEKLEPRKVPLEAASPFEMRVKLGENIAETDVRSALASGDMGFLHSFTTGSEGDGPGVRVVAWTTGCMWQCRYCHNPDTWTMRNGIPVSVVRAINELSNYRRGLQGMAGGLTVSGGEPLMQRRFVFKLLSAARAMGIHTAIETNGFLGTELSAQDLASLDLVLLGIKTWDPARHRMLTGSEIEPTLALARRLAERKLPIWIRFVLVPGLTDDADDIRRIAEFAASLGNVTRVEVLPFHQMGRFKWHALGMRYVLEETKPPSAEEQARTREIFRAAGLTTH